MSSVRNLVRSLNQLLVLLLFFRGPAIDHLVGRDSPRNLIQSPSLLQLATIPKSRDKINQQTIEPATLTLENPYRNRLHGIILLNRPI
jgi:hypothetical protein